MIVGGGGMPDGVRDKFMALAGGKAAKLVVIPTASESADSKEEEEGYLQPWRKYRAGVARAAPHPLAREGRRPGVRPADRRGHRPSGSAAATR